MKLYYEEALKILWMHLKYQVRFTDGKGREYQPFDWDCFMEEIYDEQVFNTYSNPGKVYVHLDSYKVFEPQVGDLVKARWSDTKFWYGCIKEITKGQYPLVTWGPYDAFHVKKRDILEIKQRDGKHFFIPEKED